MNVFFAVANPLVMFHQFQCGIVFHVALIGFYPLFDKWEF